MNQNELGQNIVPMPKQESPKKKGIEFLIAGIVAALAIILLSVLKFPFVEILILVVQISVVVAIATLFLKDYRYMGKKYLLGLFGGLIVIAIVGLILSFVFVAIKG